jgi:hypothetical protein
MSTAVTNLCYVQMFRVLHWLDSKRFGILTAAVMKIIFWNITPCYPSTLQMEVICYSETSIDIQRAMRRYIPEDNTFEIVKGSQDYRTASVV